MAEACVSGFQRPGGGQSASRLGASAGALWCQRETGAGRLAIGVLRVLGVLRPERRGAQRDSGDTRRSHACGTASCKAPGLQLLLPERPSPGRQGDMHVGPKRGGSHEDGVGKTAGAVGRRSREVKTPPSRP